MNIPQIVASAENVHELKATLRELGNGIDKLDAKAKCSIGVLYIEFATYRRMIHKGHEAVFAVMRELADAIHMHERPTDAAHMPRAWF